MSGKDRGAKWLSFLTLRLGMQGYNQFGLILEAHISLDFSHKSF